MSVARMMIAEERTRDGLTAAEFPFLLAAAAAVMFSVGDRGNDNQSGETSENADMTILALVLLDD
jgi:hypothetical protein